MSIFPRYALYFLPPPATPLERFGAAMLGYDAVSGDDLPFPAPARSVPDWHKITDDPRRYGFHATLKAPFTLAPGRSESKLLWACATFAETPRPIAVITPVIRPIGGFIALVPDAPSAALDQLAGDCVRDFESFRAPLTAEERARRQPDRLTARQRGYLDRWGYPYVMDEFRFHMTLTGPLDPARHDAVIAMLSDAFAAAGVDRIAVDHVAVLRQDRADARFRCIGQFALRSADY